MLFKWSLCRLSFTEQDPTQLEARRQNENAAFIAGVAYRNPGKAASGMLSQGGCGPQLPEVSLTGSLEVGRPVLNQFYVRCSTHTGPSRTAAFGKASAQNPRRVAPSANAVVRPLSNTNAIDIHSRTYPFFPPTPGTAAT